MTPTFPRLSRGRARCGTRPRPARRPTARASHSRPSETGVWRFVLAESPPCQYPRRPRANGTHEAVLPKGARGGKSPWPGTVWRPVPSVPLPQGTGVHRTHWQLQATRPLPALPAHCTCWKRGHTEVTLPSHVQRTSTYTISSNPHNRIMCVFSPTFYK